MDYRSIIESKYNRQKWQELLFDIFRNKVHFWQQPQRITADESLAKSAYYTGKIDLPDGHTIAVYEVELNDSVVIERNRAGIRNLLCSNWRGMGCSGAFMFCYRRNEAVLRFSYVSEAFTFAEDGSLRKDSTDTKRFTYLLGEGHRSRTAIQQFEKLKASDLTLKDITKAFSVEALSDLFFREYKKQYEDIIEFITGKRMVKVANKWEEQVTGEPCAAIMSEFAQFPDAEKAVRDYVKKLMGRLVFIQFLQKKGWMGCSAGEAWNDGDREFVQNLFAHTPYQNTFVDNVLEPLFDDINTPRLGDIANSVLGRNIKVPYLNGGLFEHDEYDKTAFPLPARYMKSLLDFFASYNFTIDENDPDDAEIGVDPEMLGRIFENLLEDNKDKGAFYTPREIVQYMCRESLIAYLQTDVEDEEVKSQIRAFVTTPNDVQLSSDLASSVDRKLMEVKICDPAIGSGAFPMGLLRELFACRKAIEGIDSDNAVRIKTHIIQNNIYGVDIEKGAVDIARLRFWLALIVDEKTPHALPNMDFKIMQGNSLLEQYEGIDLSGMTLDEKTKRRAKAGDAYQTTLAFDEKLALENIQKAIKQYYLTDSHDAKLSLRKIIDDNVKNYILNLKGCTPDIQRKLENLPIPNDKFFLWHIYFKEVFDKGGFDIVIGNPPYINVKRGIPEEDKVLYQVLYKTAIGQFDLFALFIEKALSMGKITTMIVPKPLINNQNYEMARKLLLYNGLCQIVVGSGIFENASVESCIYMTSRRNTVVEVYQYSSNSFTYYNTLCKELLEKNNQFIFSIDVRAEESNIISKINANTPLGELMNIKRGVEAGKKDESIVDFETNDKLLRGQDVDRYSITFSGKYILLDDKDTKKYKEYSLYQGEKLLLRRVANVIKATYDDNNYIVLNTLYCIKCTCNESAKYILAVMNSTLMSYWFTKTFNNTDIIFPYLRSAQIEQIPIRRVSHIEQLPIVTLVNRILAAKNANPLADTTAEEREIDRLVYDLYNLTEEEIDIIEST